MATQKARVRNRVLAHPAQAAQTVPAQAQPAQAQPAQAQTFCTVCGKPVKNGKTCGALCASRLANGQTAAANANVKQALSVASVPAGYVSLTGIVNPACKAAYVPISHLVKFTGGDRVMGAVPHAVCLPVYYNGTRYIAGWLATKAGLQALQTGNFSAAPAPTAWQKAWYAYWQACVKAALTGAPMPQQPKM